MKNKVMIQEDKELPLKDLCARLPYGVHILTNSKQHIRLLTIGRDLDYDEQYWINDLYDIDDVKPYLRSMSSMTEEEAKEIAILHGIKDILSVKVTSDYIDVIVDDGVCSTEIRTIWYDEIISSIEIFDWLNKNHFDFRGLIPKDLAIEVTEENNPYKD